MIPEQFMLDEAVDPRGDWTAMGLRASLFTAKTFRWMHLADGHPAMEIGIRAQAGKTQAIARLR
jgi:hypothetical protein